jgi:hypothetical protein
LCLFEVIEFPSRQPAAGTGQRPCHRGRGRCRGRGGPRRFCGRGRL